MKIIKMDNQGRGITYNNKIIFVNNALPNEDVEIDVILEKNRYCIADVKKYNIKSDFRIKPKCEYYDICGGCQLQHLSYDNQINYKIKYLNEIFKPLNISILEIETSKQFYYRNKITLQVKNKIGLYKKNSNNLIEIDNCNIVNKKINEKFKYIKELNLTGIDNIIIKSFNNNVMLVINGKEDKITVGTLKKHFDTIYINNKLMYGNRLLAQINDVKYYISPNAFFQVNIEIATKMFEYIKNILKNINAKNVIDLYCGCGSISLYIADTVDYIYGIEINESSINDANENKIINNINNVDFLCNTSDNIKISNNFDTVIVDPPRSGLSKTLINKLISSKICNIIYVSCDPITLKRDLYELKSKYNIQNIKAFDMFPNTYHVECISVLERINIEK